MATYIFIVSKFEKAGVKFINITGISRKGQKHGDLQAFDGLHPSGKQYKKWVSLLKKPAFQILKQ